MKAARMEIELSDDEKDWFEKLVIRAVNNSMKGFFNQERKNFQNYHEQLQNHYEKLKKKLYHDYADIIKDK